MYQAGFSQESDCQVIPGMKDLIQELGAGTALEGQGYDGQQICHQDLSEKV